ncbi:MAG: sulfatase-like hydrolase/transferase, partial [bacterium]|nr:sulfatase-like hydrolase/transferase [bacterium]
MLALYMARFFCHDGGDVSPEGNVTLWEREGMMRKSTHDDRLAGIDADTGEVKKCSLGAALRTPSGRREFLQTAGALAIGTSGVLSPLRVSADANQPNVLLVMTDDQGFGDLGVHGNDKVRTPNIDAFARQSVEFTQFYVCPVCAPTRSSLMTGRYNYRTGVVDTWIGRAMMHGDEVTMAEMFGGAGYRTGIFGKWHLGDCAPMRSIDQGFQESLVHYGGGMTQPSDAPGASYFDPVLVHNGEQQQYKGYCTDIFATACRQFMEAKSGKPFFAYLATNAPHVPLQIEERYMKPYLSMGLDETTARVYGMEENIDENFGMLMKTLDDLGISDNTIVIFMTDNGPQQQRYNAGMRGRKGMVYEGGIRVPFYIRWPKRFQAGESVATPAAHIDVAPTLLAACGIEKPDAVHFDGRNLLPLIEESSPDWSDRYLFFQWHRGDKPERFRDCAVRGPRYKLVNGKELYDLKDDPAESTDIAAKHPDIVEEMRKA